MLFVCVHNAGRSQMAAGWLKEVAGDRVEIWSAGSEHADQVNAIAVEAMREVGIDISGESPKILTADCPSTSKRRGPLIVNFQHCASGSVSNVGAGWRFRPP